jgi:hypothetical protein
MGASTPPPGSRCAHHDDVLAIHICERCGSFVCLECVDLKQGFGICNDCRGEWTADTALYVRPIWLIVLLSLLTLNLYLTWWFLRQFRALRRRPENAGIWAGLRAIFSVFTYPSLLRMLARAGKDHPDGGNPPGGTLALAYLLLSVLGNAVPWGGLLAVFAVLPAAKYAIAISPPEYVEQESRLQTHHIVSIAVLVPLWVLALLGLIGSGGAY